VINVENWGVTSTVAATLPLASVAVRVKVYLTPGGRVFGLRKSSLVLADLTPERTTEATSHVHAKVKPFFCASVAHELKEVNELSLIPDAANGVMDAANGDICSLGKGSDLICRVCVTVLVDPHVLLTVR
jgi:hypothetical protein